MWMCTPLHNVTTPPPDLAALTMGGHTIILACCSTMPDVGGSTAALAGRTSVAVPPHLPIVGGHVTALAGCGALLSVMAHSSWVPTLLHLPTVVCRLPVVCWLLQAWRHEDINQGEEKISHMEK